MFGRRIDLFRIFGFAVRIDLSWFVVVALVTWSLARQWFPDAQPDLAPQTYWLLGLAGALGLFASVVAHELAHALVARRFGLEMRGITLFIFGGVAEMDQEPPSPRAEFWVAVAGPIASVAVAGLFWLLGLLPLPPPVASLVGYLAFINLVLVAFNLVPAFPLDGGRVLRSLLWQWKGSLRRATRIASRFGAGFGAVLIVLGVFAVLAGQLVAGLWQVLIGLFLRQAAAMSYQQLLLRRTLEGEPVARFMKAEVVTVPRSVSVRELVEQYVYRFHHKMFPVMEGERVVGCVTTRDIRGLPSEEWERQTVGAIAAPCSAENTIAPQADAMEALGKMSRNGLSRLMVTEDERLVGMLALKDLLRFLALKVELEEGEA